MRSDQAEKLVGEGHQPDPLFDAVFADGSIENMISTEPKPREWLVQDLIPDRCPGLIVAPGGSGKGFVQLHLAVRIALGEPVGPFYVKRPRGVIIISREDDREEMHRRLHATVRALYPNGPSAEQKRSLVERVRIFDAVGVDHVRLSPDLVEHVRKVVQAVPDVGAILLDPLSKILPIGTELNAQEGAGSIYTSGDALVKATGCSVLFAHHTNKSAVHTGAQLTTTAATGSLQLVDLARFVLALKNLDATEARAFGLEDAKDHQFLQMEVAKANYSQRLPAPFVFERVSGGALVWRPAKAKAEAESERLVKMMGSVTWKMADLISSAGALKPKIGKNRIPEILDELVDAGRVVKVQKGGGRQPALYQVPAPVDGGKMFMALPHGASVDVVLPSGDHLVVTSGMEPGL